MSGDSTGQVLGAVSTGGGVAMLPATGDNILAQLMVMSVISMGAVVLVSFTSSRIYKRIKK